MGQKHKSRFKVKHRLVHLDCLRGGAALLVCLGHLRAFLFIPYEQIKSPNLLEQGFYFVTGLGHQAVMIFFVMSGFLVGGSVISAHQKGQWTWTGYALRRLTRLWMVLIPALLLTLVWDTVGQQQALAGYNGAYHEIYNSGPGQNRPADLRPLTFLGNTFFLQTISVNCFGTNGPLWSLANEFWYYLLFPLLLGIFVRSGLWSPVSGLRFQVSGFRFLFGVLLFVAALLWLPKGILMGGLVWLLGAGVFAAIQNDRIRSWAAQPWWLAGSGLLLLALLAASRFGKLGGAGDLWLGLGCACLVSALAVRPASGSISGFRFQVSGFSFYARLSAAASEFSYTLYLVHFPVLACLFYTVFKGQQMTPGWQGALWFAGILAGIIIYASAVWWLFERNTDRLRKRIEPILIHRRVE